LDNKAHHNSADEMIDEFECLNTIHNTENDKIEGIGHPNNTQNDSLLSSFLGNIEKSLTYFDAPPPTRQSNKLIPPERRAPPQSQPAPLSQSISHSTSPTPTTSSLPPQSKSRSSLAGSSSPNSVVSSGDVRNSLIGDHKVKLSGSFGNLAYGNEVKATGSGELSMSENSVSRSDENMKMKLSYPKDEEKSGIVESEKRPLSPNEWQFEVDFQFTDEETLKAESDAALARIEVMIASFFFFFF
jgi:hypothetical protein